MKNYVRATDLGKLTKCNRQVYLDHNGDPALRAEVSPFRKWIQQAGQAHEAAVADRMGAADAVAYPVGDLEEGFRLTLDAMRRGVDTIYQGVLIHDRLVGIPDLLIKTPGSSRWGKYAYRPADIKLGSTLQEGDRLQVMAYIALLEAIQGVRPEGTLILRAPPAERSDEHQTVEERVVFDAPLFEARIGQVYQLSDGAEPDPFISSTCSECPWRELCIPIAEKRQDVSLVPGLKRKVWHALHERGLGTLPAAASASKEALINIKGVGEKTALDIIRRSQALSQGRVIQIGTPALPESDAAVFFDIESVPSEGIIYLWGMLVRRGSDEAFEYVLARHPDEEPARWQDFLDRIGELPGPVYHYGYYERMVLKRFLEKHGPDPRVDALTARLVDLKKQLTDSVVLPLRGNSLKDVAPWLGYKWTGETQAADDSMVEYLSWLEDGQVERIEHILAYNEHDCRATAAVYDWLKSLRGTD